MSKRERIAVPETSLNINIPSTIDYGGSGAPLREFPPDLIEQSIHECFESQVSKHADRIAIKTPTTTLTYAELDRVANSIANLILAQIGDGLAQIGLILSNGPLMISALLGVLKAGKAYVPLDPLFPPKRLAYMIDDANVSLLMTNPEHLDLTKSLGSKVPFLDVGSVENHTDYSTGAAIGQPSNQQRKVDPKSMAYILYTSGSTGQPKGIAFGHRNLIHTTMCLISQLEITHEERMTQLHSTSFSASIVDIYCALLAGATLYPWDIKQHGFAGLADWLIAEKVTSLQWIPTPFRHFVDTFDGSECFHHLRQIIMASEPLTSKEVALVRRHFPPTCRLVNQMGTSESYNYRLYFLAHDAPLEGSGVPAGYAVSRDREVLILDEAGQTVPAGIEGEIAIRSPYMSLGYWKNSALTQEKFVTDTREPHKQIFLTGDLGYLQPDGCLIHLGRKDFQVKLRGYRVELGAIETKLCELDGVAEAIVQTQQLDDDDLQLVAYVISKSELMPSRKMMQRHLAAVLPDYMIPSAFVQMHQLPVTDTGKIDRRALPRVDFGLNGFSTHGPSGLPKHRPPHHTTLHELQKIWRNVLGLEVIGCEDRFFEKGGHSLKMAQLLQHIHRTFGRKLPYELLMQNPTLSEMASWLDEGVDNSMPSSIELVDTETAIPDGLLRGIVNRIWQALALYAPGRKSLRVLLHRLRGVTIGTNVAIGTAVLIETSNPKLVAIGNNSSIGIRTVIVGHFVDGLGATPMQWNRAVPTLNHIGGFSLARDKSDTNKSVIIEDDVFIGPMVTILPNVTIGRGSVIAAGSVVNQSVPPRTIVQGNPARVIARCPVPLTDSFSYEEFLSKVEFVE